MRWATTSAEHAKSASPVRPALAAFVDRMTASPTPDLATLLARIADALDRIAGPRPPASDLGAADAFVWQAATGALSPVPRVNRVEIALLRGIDRLRDQLAENTMRFARGLPANNALLWGARGMGKSSLVKAVHGAVNAGAVNAGAINAGAVNAGAVDAEADRPPTPLKLVEIHREDIETLPDLMGLLRADPHRFVVFCDDLSFDGDDASYKSLKAVLEGGIEGRPENVLFYATSNRRHLLQRDMAENERGTAINPGEAVEEKVSLSDRFGLWLGFHKCSQDDYLEMVFGYADRYGLADDRDAVGAGALEWAMTRGSRSGRTAWQFIQELAGHQGRRLDSEAQLLAR